MKEIKFLLMFSFMLFFVVRGRRDSMNTARFLSDVVEHEEKLEEGRKCGIIILTRMKIPPNHEFLSTIEYSMEKRVVNFNPILYTFSETRFVPSKWK